MGGGDLVPFCPKFVKYFFFILHKDFCFLGQKSTILPAIFNHFLSPLFRGFLIILIIPS